jgi:hypothetical protein
MNKKLNYLKLKFTNTLNDLKKNIIFKLFNIKVPK